LTRVSPFLESEPQEGVEGGLFLNAVAEIATSLSPRQLLHHLREIEAALGRPLGHEPRSARTMDLDILLYGDMVMSEPDLVIPHPRMIHRRFVLAPLVAIAPATRHPVLGITAEELLRRLGSEASGSLAGVSR
jgi:2-amino-4-hydroxy-6-hydroxymethyldihydropteridine diphosphokinase